MNRKNPAAGTPRHRLVMTALGLALLALGSGCVYWEPVFQITNLFKAAAGG